MTAQQLLEALIRIQAQMKKIIDNGMEARYVDMQNQVPLEVQFDFQNLKSAFDRFYEHGN